MRANGSKGTPEQASWPGPSRTFPGRPVKQKQALPLALATMYSSGSSCKRNRRYEMQKASESYHGSALVHVCESLPLMELSFWSWLCSDDSGVLLRQRIPEVALFYGCRLEAWYHNVGGLLVTERAGGSITTLLERFKEVSEGPARPVAILRHESKGNPREGIPAGTIVPVLLSLHMFTEILKDVVEGRVVNLKSGSLSGFWSLQSYVEPRYGLRFLSAYACDAHLEERHDTFSQPFQKCYSLDGGSQELPQDEANAKKLRLDAPQRDAIESKALGIVRYAHRFHKLDIEGWHLIQLRCFCLRFQLFRFLFHAAVAQLKLSCSEAPTCPCCRDPPGVHR